ncbi:MAG: 50S ribosomal protein L4 [Eubacteriales bacterium]|jgi:large subunit ribosomal protein L4|nr:50S ribosomal protein L4 [Oscillospiraceae bacterium]MBQ1246415.1 50S ribosomal protein L4 [Clostridiales bacterium]MDO4421485.1 50S ribosomal protein L4 [Eubacteriales bacterium]MBQ1294755.1 50S ribosomal protein L4 [Clostridiales bacterium]MBQ5768199.1 50S ribosomal protein L4 [Clostridiales bacterium]
MAKIDVKDLTGAVKGSIELSDEIFGIEPNEVAMSTVVRNQLANKRQGTQKTKTRSEVSGGGKRPYRQKGTGRARHGSERSAQYVGGGIIFGPNPRSYSYTVPKKVKRLALKSALSSKVADQKLIVVENMDLDEVKTATVAKALKAIGAGNSSLIVLEDVNKNAELSARNIKDVKTALVNTINVLDILKYDSFVATKAAVEKIEEVYK